MPSTCKLCDCQIHREGDYARPTPKGRSHATKHHFVAERFFGRSQNRPGKSREAIFSTDPWKVEGQTEVFCYECHEELIHNPVFLPEDISNLAKLIRSRNLTENEKSDDRKKIADRIKLLHEVIQSGLKTMLERR